MGLLSFGTSNNALNASQQNSIINDMSFYFGDDNTAGGTEFGGQSLENKQEQKEETGISASVGVGLGGSGSGGQASLQKGGDSEEYQKSSTDTGLTNSFIPKTTTQWLLYGVIGIGIIGMGFMGYKLSKKSK